MTALVFAALVVGLIGGFVASRHGEERRLYGRLSRRKEMQIRGALHRWADKYATARPSGKYLKLRDAELFEVCAQIGTMWIEPLPEDRPHLPTFKNKREVPGIAQTEDT